MVYLIALGIVVLSPLAVPMQCQGVTSKAPYRGCRKGVFGLLGQCRHHGRQARRRLIWLLGGSQLLQRQVCDKCGEPRVFGRLQDSGKPFLGCSRYPACKSPRLLTR